MQKWLTLIVFGALFLGTGCTTKKPQRDSYPTVNEVSARLKNLEDPDKYWIKVYRTKTGPRFIDANRTHINQEEETSFITSKRVNLPVIDASVRKNQNLAALIDTMSEKNWIDFYTANKFNVLTLGPDTPYFIQPKHVKDPLESVIGLIPKFRIGSLHIESVIANIRPQNMTLGPLGRGIDRPDPEMVLGHDFLKAFSIVQLDFLEQKVRLSVSSTYQPSPEHIIAALPFEYGPRGILVNGALEHYRGNIAIDVAGDYELAIPYPERPVETQLILDGLVRRSIPVTDSLTLGFGADSIPSIGQKMMHDLIVTIDNRAKKIYFELP
jgi:hypothetical protein